LRQDIEVQEKFNIIYTLVNIKKLNVVDQKVLKRLKLSKSVKKLIRKCQKVVKKLKIRQKLTKLVLLESLV
jgi:hypothetical protein